MAEGCQALLHAHLCIIQMRDDNPMLNLITSHFLLLFLESTHWGLLYSQLWMKLLSDSTSIRGTLFIWILEYIPREEEWIFKEAWNTCWLLRSGAIPPAHQQLLLMIIYLGNIASGERVTAAKKECPHSSTWAHLHSILGTNPKRLQHMHIWIQFYFNDVLHIYVCGSIQFCNLEIICFCVAVYIILKVGNLRLWLFLNVNTNCEDEKIETIRKVFVTECRSFIFHWWLIKCWRIELRISDKEDTFLKLKQCMTDV